MIQIESSIVKKSKKQWKANIIVPNEKDPVGYCRHCSLEKNKK